MDRTQAFDPNRTQIGAAPQAGDPGRTVAMPALDANRTRMMDPLAGFDPNKTAMTGMSGNGLLPGISVQIIPGREAAMANGPVREQWLLEIAAGGGGPVGISASVGQRTPLNLCLVIDRSGSMEGAPLEYVKQACAFVVDMLGPDDVLSIVTFEESVDVLMPPQRVTSKEPIKAGIARLMPGNTTNLYDGLALGLQQVLQLNDPGHAPRMVVLTDGDPTAGIKDFSALTTHAGEIRKRGVTVTFLGFGPDYNEELLAGMAKRAGGNYHYIAQPQMIPDVFRTELDKAMSVGYRDVKLALKPARWTELRAPQNAKEGQEIVIPLADLERGTTMTQVIDMEFKNHPLGWYRVAAGRLTYDDLAEGGQKTVDIDLVIEFTSEASKYGAPQDSRVSGAAQVALASKQVEKTVMGLKTGMLTQAMAVQELQKTQMLLTSEGRLTEAREVTMALQALQMGDAGSAEKTLMGTAISMEQGKR